MNWRRLILSPKSASFYEEETGKQWFMTSMITPQFVSKDGNGHIDAPKTVLIDELECIFCQTLDYNTNKQCFIHVCRFSFLKSHVNNIIKHQTDGQLRYSKNKPTSTM